MAGRRVTSFIIALIVGSEFIQADEENKHTNMCSSTSLLGFLDDSHLL